MFVQYNSFDSSVTHKRSFLLLHSTGADLGDLLGGLAQPRAAEAAPNPEEEPGSVPVPGGVGCFRAEKLQQFFFVFFLFLK